MPLLRTTLLAGGNKITCHSHHVLQKMESESNFIVSLWPLSDAIFIGVMPHLSSTSISAPCSSSTRVNSRFPEYDDLCSGVEPSLARAFTSTPYSNNTRATLGSLR